jgi:hypothetical protein
MFFLWQMMLMLEEMPTHKACSDAIKVVTLLMDLPLG